MNRRAFLSLFAVGAPAAVVAEKLGLVERLRSYFFAPRGGWDVWDGTWRGLSRFPVPPLQPNALTSSGNIIALQLENLRAAMPTIYRNDLILADYFDGRLAMVYSMRGRYRGVIQIRKVDPKRRIITLEDVAHTPTLKAFQT